MGLCRIFTSRTRRIARLTIFGENWGSYSRDPCSPRQTIEQPLHGLRFDRPMAYMAYECGLDYPLESSFEMDCSDRYFCAQSRA